MMMVIMVDSVMTIVMRFVMMMMVAMVMRMILVVVVMMSMMILVTCDGVGGVFAGDGGNDGDVCIASDGVCAYSDCGDHDMRVGSMMVVAMKVVVM